MISVALGACLKTAYHSSKPVFKPMDAIKLFNEFQSQSRARGEATLKLAMGVSGAMLTLSVGAVLSATPADIPPELLPSLQLGWSLLFYCIAASLILMASFIVSTFHIGVRLRKALDSNGPEAFQFVATWGWLRILNAILGLSILVSCLAGIGLVAQVAIGVAEQLASSPANAIAPAQPTRASELKRYAPDESTIPHDSSRP